MGPRPRRDRTEKQLAAWLDRLEDTLPSSIENHDSPGHGATRDLFLKVLGPQVDRMLTEPAAYRAAKCAVRAFAGDRCVDAVEWLAAACGQPSKFA